MFARLQSFLARHPILRDAIVWAIPAILFGAVLRLLLLDFLPYAYWGRDSRSYFSFAHKLLTQGYLSLDEKRRFLYPILMVPVSILPGSPLKWLAWLQHGLGLVSLVPMAYIVRKTFCHWRLWIIPVTVIYAGFPMVLWYEHELLGETIFFTLLLWSFAGWVAWVGEPQLARSRRLFWCFFVPFALFILTKPALGALVVMTLTVGSKKQGAWLLYVATFPLTQIDSPLHANYKAEIRDKIQELQSEIGTYYLQDDWAFSFLENTKVHPDRPLWQALGDDSKLKSKLYMELAMEGIKAEPLQLFHLAFQRFVGSANPSQFKDSRFTGNYYISKFESMYRDGELKDGDAIRMLFALPQKGPLPPYSEFQTRLAPTPDSWSARFIPAYVRAFESVSDFFRLPDAPEVRDRQATKARLTPLGWWMAIALLLSLLPRYRATLGVWMIIAMGYLAGVFLVSQINPRYFGLAWPVLVPLLAVPADLLTSLLLKVLRRSPSPPAEL